MTTQPNAIPEARFESQIIAPASPATVQQIYWSLRRELWEYRSIYIAPLAVALLFLIGFLISTVHLPERMRAVAALTPMQQHVLIEKPYNLAALLIMGSTFLVGLFYCLEALHGERRDRSILFWKSLPVSDFTTVLSKACVPLVVIPVLTFIVTVATQWLMLLLSSAVLLANGVSATPLWAHLSLFQMWVMLLYHLVTVHSLWYAPIFAWLLLVSSWAKRATNLWAILPLLAIGVVEKIAFNTAYFAIMIGNRLGGGAAGGDFGSGGMSMMSLSQLTPGKFLLSPGLWIGLGVAAAFLAAAVGLRRNRGVI